MVDSSTKRDLCPAFWQELSGKIAPDSLIFDLGTHHLEEAELLVPHLERAEWHGFEPNFECYRYSTEHVATRLMASHACSIVVTCAAVGRARGDIDFYLSSKKSGESWTPSSSTRKPKNALVYYPWMDFKEVVRVPVMTLDEYAEEHGLCERSVGLVKMDIQGAEIDAVLGGQGLLSRTKLLVVEVVEGEEYEGQVGLQGLLDALPGRWEIVERLVSDALLVNLTPSVYSRRSSG